MNSREEEFLRRLRATFKVEAEEHVQTISTGLLALEKNTDPATGVAKYEIVFRHAHSLKGAARAVNYAEVETLCQVLEDAFAAGKNRKREFGPGDFDVLHRGVDLIGKLVAAAEIQGESSARLQVTAMRQALEELLVGNRADTPSARRAGSIAPFEPPRPGSRSPVPATAASAPPFAPLPAGVARPVLADTIRVPTTKLDRLLLQAEEMLSAKQGANHRVVELQEFDALFQRLTKRWATVERQMRETQPTTAGDWDLGDIKVLEEKLRVLRKAAAREQHEVSKQVGDLLAESKQLVMLPFLTLADLFPKLVRDLTRDQRKEAQLLLQGGDVEVDKRVLEKMKDPLIHLLRNCVDHGVELPAQRVAQGKPSQASIVLAVTPLEGNRIEIRVTDDGAGVDPERVKAAAIRHGQLTPDRAAQLTEAQAQNLIFLSEVSTSPMITEISGRGLGLAIVREQAEALGGQVFLESRRAAGTTFRLILPVAMSTFHGVMVRTAGQCLVLPTASVERVARVKLAEIRTVENRETVNLDGRLLALAHLTEVLELPAERPAEIARVYLPVVVLGSGEERVAFGVDEVLHDEEVLVKSLVPPLVRVRNVAGATLLASGKVAVILNPLDLLKSARKQGAPRATAGAASEPESPSHRRTVLLVEDSITSRMLLKGILEMAGYRVRTAVDGVEALTLLRTEEFDLVVSDVEMPRMNGFDLTATIRADKRLADIPVVLVTALASQVDREHGVDVGASAYIVKGSFDQSNLLEAVRRLI